MIPTIREYITEYENAGRKEMNRLVDVLAKQKLDETDLLDVNTRLLVDAVARARHLADKILREHGYFDYPGRVDNVDAIVEDAVTAILRIYDEERRQTPDVRVVNQVEYTLFQLLKDIRRDDFVAKYETDPEFSTPCLAAIEDLFTGHGTHPYPEDATAEKAVKIRHRAMYYIEMKPRPTVDDFRPLVVRASNELEFDDPQN